MSNNTREYHKNRREDWATPQDLFDKVNAIFDFKIDLAARADNTKCPVWIGETDGADGKGLLTEDIRTLLDRKGVYPWEWAWCNPPYGPNGCGKIMEAILRVSNTVSLIPAPVGAKWFLEQVWKKADTIVFFHGRLKFEGAPGKAMFDSVLVVKGAVTVEQLEQLAEIGSVVDLGTVRLWKGEKWN